MPVPLRRYALVALLGLGGLVMVLLLVRPFIFSFAGARDDANYPVAAATDVDPGPLVTDVLLEEDHGIPGAAVEEGRYRVRLVLWELPGQGGYSAVNAWSPVNDCPLEVAEDRLVDCAGDTWTFPGAPFDAAHPFLLAFGTEVRQAAIVVDFTQPADPSR